jgi:multiple sugar transport system permease protein
VTTIASQNLDVDEARADAARLNKPQKQRKNTLLTIIMIVCTLYFLLPLYWLLVASTKSNADLFSTFGLWFAHFSLVDNIKNTFTIQNGVFSRWIANSLIYSVSSAVGATLLATAAGYAFAKYKFPFGNALFSIILGAIMIPTTALAIPTYLLFAQAQLTDTYWSIILPSLVNPFGVYLMRVYAADAVDYSLIEAARVDGVGEIRIFFQVAFRLLMPGAVTVFLFTLVATWNNYFLPLIMLSTPEKFPIPVGLAQWQSTSSAGSGGQALFSTVITGSMVSVVPLILAFIFLQRFWQSGLSSGGVKA